MHIGENNSCGSEVSDGDVVSSDVLLAVGELLLEVVGEVGDVFDVLGLGFFVELLAHLVGVKSWDDISAIVDHVVSVVSLIVVSGVVSVLLAKETEDGAGLVVLLAALNPDGELTVVEFAGSLAWSELFEAESLVLELSFSVR